MTKEIVFKLRVEVSEHDFYADPNRAACRRCVFYSVCNAIMTMHEKFPYSFVKNSKWPCRQQVPAGERRFYKFSSKE